MSYSNCISSAPTSCTPNQKVPSVRAPWRPLKLSKTHFLAMSKCISSVHGSYLAICLCLVADWFHLSGIRYLLSALYVERSFFQGRLSGWNTSVSFATLLLSMNAVSNFCLNMYVEVFQSKETVCQKVQSTPRRFGLQGHTPTCMSPFLLHVSSPNMSAQRRGQYR